MTEGSTEWGQLGAVAKQVLNDGQVTHVSAAPREFIEQVRRRGVPRKPRTWLFAPLVAACAMAALAFWFRGTTEAISFVQSGVLEVDGLLAAEAQSVGSLEFSDGSRVSLLESETRVRVLETSAYGASVELRSGTAAFAVKHEANTEWSVSTGPFRVRVTGTRFELSWSELAQRLELNLHEGSVVVSGGQLSQEQRLRAGDRFVVLLSERRQELTRIDSTPPEEERVTEDLPPQPPVADTLPAPPQRSFHPSSPAPPRRADWAELLRDGQFKEVVSAARVRGLSTCMATCSLAELRALADAARYLAKSTIARRSLTAQRQRFAGTAAAGTAAFLLGRVEEQAGNMASARQWYSRYLKETPNGSLASESKSRLKRLRVP